MILLGYCHGLQVLELIALRWEMLALVQGLIYVTRRKHGVPSTHPLRGPELRSVKDLRNTHRIPLLPLCAQVNSLAACLSDLKNRSGGEALQQGIYWRCQSVRIYVLKV